MSSAPVAVNPDYLFRFDQPIQPVVFGGELKISGWLLHREGKPIHGLRALVRPTFARAESFRGRRKRNRPDAAAAYPDRPEASASGFLLELQLGLGRNHLTFQVLDHERRWQDLSTASIKAFPFSLLEKTGFIRTRGLLLSSLQRRFEARAPHSIQPSRINSSAVRLPNRIDLFATSKSNLFMVEIGELVAAGFRELGCEAQLHLDRTPDEHPSEGTMQMVIAPHEYHLLFLTKQVSRERAVALTSNVYLLCTEQPETGWFQGALQWAHHSLGVADINPLGVAAYRAEGIPARPLSLGYHPLLAHPQPPPQSERKYDITFLGSMTPRREQFIARHADFFASHQCHLRLVPLEFAKTKETRSYLPAAQRNELLSQSRILLNLHHAEQKYFEWHRVLLGLANGCCVITETCRGYGGLVPNEHFIMVEPEHLIAACEYFLAHPAEREKIARAGQKFVESELRQAQMCGEFLREISESSDESSSFEIPTDQAAAPLPPELRHQIGRQDRRVFVSTIAEDFRRLVGQPEQTHVSSSPLVPQSRAVVIEQREGYRNRFTAQEEARARGESVFQIHDNAALTRLPEPALSVVVTLFNYAQHIDECVASIERASERFSQPLELVIVNDASTDDSLTRALNCLATSQLLIRVVDKKFNTGLADARNMGTEISRAPYVFMMDADNLVYPDALRQLFAAITLGNYAAAYSLLCRFRDTPDNRIGLLSYFDWDPQILMQYPYIDAMAMFRRETLLQVGGYDNELNQIGWFGWEDYDMWLRFAQRNLPVAFVPNTLCLYRDHATSMINTTSLFASELVHHFVERYGDLLDRFEPRARIFGFEREKVGRGRVAEPEVADKLPLS